jgi:predicted glycogen debranching enzyme
MPDLDTREWLLTNGLGSFASGTVSDVRTRTYHGWLFAATNPPCGRTLLLSHLEASLEVSERVMALGTNFWGSGKISPAGYKLLRSFDINPVPKWIWGEDEWQLSRQLVMPHGWENGEMERWGKGNKQVTPSCSHRILIQYRYEGSDTAILRLRLLICDRDFHHQQHKHPEHPDLQFSQLLGQNQICFQAILAGKFGTPWHLRWTDGEYQADADWYWDYNLPEETQRGLGDREDLYSPGINSRNFYRISRSRTRTACPDFWLGSSDWRVGKKQQGSSRTRQWFSHKQHLLFFISPIPPISLISHLAATFKSQRPIYCVSSFHRWPHCNCWLSLVQ